MNPSYLLLRRPLADALSRYAAWIGVPEVEAPRELTESQAIDAALDGEEWKGLAVYVFSSAPWTVFEELSGGLATRSTDDWLRLADGGDLTYAGFNDAIGYGELLVVERGRLVRHYRQDEQEPEDDVDVGRLPQEDDDPIEGWPDVAKWVEEREDELTGRERGRLWIHRSD